MMQQIITINKWQAAEYDKALPDQSLPGKTGEWFDACVPGAIQYDLVRAGRLENPYASTKAAFDAAWAAKTDWLYRGSFDTPQNISSMAMVVLRMKGVDTYSEIWLNGTFIGETADAMRIYDFPLKPELFAPEGNNSLLVRVKSHERMIAGKIDETEKHLHNGKEVESRLGKSLIRRYQRSFFSGSSLLNLGTGVLGIGINREVQILLYPGAWLSDLCFRTEKIENSKALGKAIFTAENTGKNTKIKITLTSADGAEAAAVEKEIGGGEQELAFSIDNPKLWWPAGYGKPYLYRLRAELIQNGQNVYEAVQNIGIRTVELVKRDPGGKKTFYFKINNRKIFVHGENHIPLDYIKSYGSPEEYARLFRLLENQYVNLIRIWGGGVVEDDSYYERCDKMGILVWHDMFLHSNTYPDYDSEFVNNFLAEAEGVLRQIRSHPCFALVCGGNEQQEGWDEWGWKGSLDRFYGEKLFNEYLPPLVEKLCPDLPYIPNSPHGGKWAQSPVEGECHNWGNFYNSTKDPVFVTETCWTSESYSRPETLKKYMGLDVDSPEFSSLGWAEKWKERTGLGLLNRMPYSNWFTAETLRCYLHELELEQLRADYSALSMYRFRSPSNSGVVYWSFNKGGPLFQFGCVDYGGYAMMPYYAVKRIFAPAAVHAYRDVSDIAVMLSNHSLDVRDINVEVCHLDKKGRALGKWAQKLKSEPGALQLVLRLEGLYGKVHERTEEIIYVCAFHEGKLLADDMLFFCPFSEYEGEYHPLKTGIEKSGQDKWLIHIGAKTPARLIELESNHKLLYSDNYFPVVPGRDKLIEVSLLERTGSEPIRISANILGSVDRQSLELK
jgi:beta-mannosidase